MPLDIHERVPYGVGDLPSHDQRLAREIPRETRLFRLAKIQSSLHLVDE